MNHEPPFKKNILRQTLASHADLMQAEKDQILNWNASFTDHDLIRRIVSRSKDIAKRGGVPLDENLLAMDITAVHLNSCPLNLYQILLSDDTTFHHDTILLGLHVDRKTGQLKGGFKPLLAKVKS